MRTIVCWLALAALMGMGRSAVAQRPIDRILNQVFSRVQVRPGSISIDLTRRGGPAYAPGYPRYVPTQPGTATIPPTRTIRPIYPPSQAAAPLPLPVESPSTAAPRPSQEVVRRTVEAEPGYLGLIADDLLEPGVGVEVLSVREGAAAAEAGVRPGDIITAINGDPIRSLDAMSEKLSGLLAGSQLVIRLDRGDERQHVVATLGPQPNAAADGDRAAGPPALGVDVVSVSSGIRSGFAIYVRRGAVVTAVTEGSPATAAGIRPGSVIVGVDDASILTPDDLVEQMATKRRGQEISVLFYQAERLRRVSVRLGSSTPARPERFTPAPQPADASGRTPPPRPTPPRDLPTPGETRSVPRPEPSEPESLPAPATEPPAPDEPLDTPPRDSPLREFRDDPDPIAPPPILEPEPAPTKPAADDPPMKPEPTKDLLERIRRLEERAESLRGLADQMEDEARSIRQELERD